MASALALQCSTNRAMNTHMLGADQFIEFIFTRDRNETWNEVDLNCGNTLRRNGDVIIEVVIAIYAIANLCPPKNFFGLKLLKLRLQLTAMMTSPFHLYSRSSNQLSCQLHFTNKIFLVCVMSSRFSVYRSLHKSKRILQVHEQMVSLVFSRLLLLVAMRPKPLIHVQRLGFCYRIATADVTQSLRQPNIQWRQKPI